MDRPVSQRAARWSALATLGCLAFLTAPLPAPSHASDFSARHIGDFGNVTVMQVAGNYDAELTDGTVNYAPRETIAREFYQIHKDDYDFLIIFSDFDFKMPEAEAIAFYLGVKNDTQGIGLTPFDNTSFYGSAGKLQGMVDMGNLANNVADPLDPLFEDTLGTLNHEILHRWGAFLKFQDHNGQTSSALLGKDGDHWSYLLDTRGSLHYGGRWQDNGDGTFTATETRTYFSPLDLYVMGMLDASEVPLMLLIENADLDPHEIPKVGTTISGTPRTVTIDDIIAVEGPRIPSAAEAQKSFKTAFIFATSSGAFSQADLRKLENIRNGFLPRFSILTDGQGLVQVAVTPKEDLQTNPGITPVNPAPRTLPPSIDEGITWLLGNQLLDGSWLDTESTRLRDTSEAITALKAFGVSGQQINLGIDWLNSSSLTNTDYLSRRIQTNLKAGVDVGALLTDLIARQNADGGWGLSRHFSSNPADTALALKALGRGRHSGLAVAKAVTYLAQCQNADGGWSGDGAISLIQPTANALLALASYRNSYPLGESIDLGVAFLQQKQNPDGGFGNSPSTIYDSAAALLALNEIGALASVAGRGTEYLLALQTANGSWYDSPYQTAMAVQAVYQATVLPDLAISPAGISFIPEKIVKLPTNAVINVEIANLGRTAVPQAVVALYEGSGAEAVRIDEQMAAFPPESSVVVTFAVPVLEGRDHLFTVVVDPDNLVEEQSVANNSAGKFLRPERTYDFIIEPGQLTVTPNPVGILEFVGVSATVRNAGTSDAFNVPIRFFVEDGSDTIQIATKPVDIRANGTATVEAVWQASRAGVLTVVAQADPQNAFVETDESNNRASGQLQVNSSTLPNLTVTPADLSVAPDPARQGEMATITALVRNNGFSAAEEILAAFFLGVPGGDFVQLGSQTIPRIEPGQSAALAIDWESIPDHGNRSILVRIDPDNTIAEIRKDDNEAVIALPILSFADLTLSPGAIEIFPAAPKEGDEVSVHVAILNVGDQEARDVVVNLYESNRLLGTRSIAVIDGRSQASILFPYSVTEGSGIRELTAVVDPENLIRELRLDNNTATKTFIVQNASLWLSERYISPNGDGIQDETRLGFSLDVPASVSVAVVNEHGEMVRTFAGAEFQGALNGSVLWDGLNDQGGVVADGQYQMQIRSLGGVVLQSASVTVDNNRSPLAAAAGTKYLFRQEIEDINVWNLDDVAWLPDESGILFNSRYGSNTYPNPLKGLNIHDLKSGSRQLLTPEAWFAPPFGDSELTFALSPDGQKVAIALNVNDGKYHGGLSASGQLWVLDMTTRELKLVEENKVQFTRYGIPRTGGYVSSPEWSADGKRLKWKAFKTVNTGNNPEYNDNVYALDFDLLKPFGNSGTISPDGENLAYIKYNDLHIENAYGDLVTVGLPGSGVRFKWINNNKIVIASSSGVWDFDHKQNEIRLLLKQKSRERFFSPDGSDLILFDWDHDSSYKIINTSFVMYDLLNETIVVQSPTDIEWLMDWYESNWFWSPDGKMLHVVGNSNGGSPILVVFDLLAKKINYINPNIECDYIYAKGSSFIDQNFVVANFYMNNRFSDLCFDGELTYFINLITGDFFAIPMVENYVNHYIRRSPLGYHLYFQDNYKFTTIKSLLSLTVDLNAVRQRSEIVLKGTAADLNFAGYRLEYADSKTPHDWQLLQPPSDSPVVDDILAAWVPPHKGTFHVRLTVWDKAGNVAWDQKRVTWGDSSKITSLYITEAIFSPNGDGIKDTVQLHYTVTDSIQLTFSIHDANQRLVRTFDKVHTAPGKDLIVWDGRDDQGEVVPDGIYRLNVSGYDFFVEVDTTAPMVALTLEPFDVKERSAPLTGFVYDQNMGNWRIEYGQGDNPVGWHILAEGQEALAQRASDGQVLLDPLREVLIRTLNSKEIGRFAGHRFRIVAEDRAGNRSSVISGMLEEGIYLYQWDGVNVADIVPATLVRPGLHQLTGLETYRFSFTEYSLQYRLGKDWQQAPAEIVSESGLIRVEWNNSPVAKEFNAIRLRGVDEAGQEHFSNILTTAQIFSVASKCDQGVWGSNYLFENLQDLRYQHRFGVGIWLDYAVYDVRWETIPEGLFLMIPPREPGQVRLAATGLSGREYYSNAVPHPAPCSHAPKVAVEIQYSAGGICGGLGEQATITAQVEGKGFSPLSLSIFLEQDSGDQLQRRFEKALFGSIALNTGELAEGTIPVRVEFTYEDLVDGSMRLAAVSSTLVVDRTSPAAQITFPAGGSLALCPLSVADPEGGWHGLPIEAMVLDNYAVRRYELRYGLGENPSVWLPAMTRQGKDRRQIAGEGPVKGRIGLWDLSGLQGTAYTLKLIVVDVAGNTTCHTATISVDTLVAINDLSADRKFYSPFGDDLLGGFFIGEPALIDIEVLPLLRNPDHTFRLGQAPVRRLETGMYHPGGAESFSWDGRDQAGAVVNDGDYALAVRATDSCGNGSLRWVPVTVDGTAPALAISYPTPGSPLRSIIEVKGSVSDAHLASYTLTAGQEEAPDSWRTIVQKSTQVDEGVLGAWNTFGLEGVWKLRLSAWDRAGNESHALVTVDLGQRTSIIRNLEIEPRIFSPNNDGRLDQAVLLYDLAAASQIGIEIVDKQGQQVRNQVLSAADGPSSFVWNGKDSYGAVVPDGEYRVRFTAAPMATPDFDQTEEVTIVVDSTPPTLVLPEPMENAFLNVMDLAVSGTIRDQHLLEYAVEVAGPGGTRPVDDGNQNRIDITFGVLRGLEEGIHVLSFAVEDQAGNTARLDRTFTIDRSAPKVRLDAPLNASYFGGSETLIRIAGEVIEENPGAYSLRYGLGANPTQWIELTDGQGLPTPGELFAWEVGELPDGEYTLSLQAVDRAGLEGEARIRITIDNTPPEVAIASPAEGVYINKAAEIKGTVLDANFKQAVVSVSEGSCAEAYRWAPLRSLTGPVQDGIVYSWPILPQDGEYCLRLAAEDKLGNEASVHRGFRIDTQPPGPPELQGEFAEQDALRLEWTANTEADLAGYNLYRNGQKITANPVTETVRLDANLAEGNYLYTVRAIDLAGNESESSNEVKRRVDLTPPTVKITAPQEGARLSNFVDIRGAAFSADDFREYRIYVGTGDAPSAWALLRRSPLPVNLGLLARWDLLSLGEGVHSIRLEAEDLSGNIASQQVSVWIDNTPPGAPHLVSAVASGANVAIDWEAVGDADLAGYLLFRNHRLVNASGLVIGELTPYLLSGTSYADSNVPDGIFEYHLLAMDQAGNQSDPSNTRPVTIDTRAPKATIVEPLAGEEFDRGFMVRAESPDEDIASMRLQYRRSTASTWLSLTTPITSAPYVASFDPLALNLTYGTYHFRAEATDWGGKTDSSPAFIAVTYTDLTPPEVPKDLTALSRGSDIQLNWTTNTEADLAGYNIYRVTGTLRTKINGSLINGTQYLHLNLTDGGHLYEITAVDLYGNESAASERVSARIYAPRLSPLAFGLTGEAQITLSGSGAEPDSTVEIHLQTPSGPVPAGSGSTGSNGEFTVEGIPLLLGDNSLVARAIDSKGGTSKYSAPLVVFRGTIPQMPSGLTGYPQDYTVELSWNSNPEADQIFGYNIFRDGKRLNDQQVKITSGTPSASSTNGSFAPARAVDDDPATYWQSSTSNTAQVPVWFELALPQSEVVRRFEIDWGWTWSYAGRDFQVQGWTGTTWVMLASFAGNTQRISHIDLTSTMATSRLRVHITGFNSWYGIIVIAELGIFRDVPIKDPAFIDSQGLKDGEYRYQVTAVNQLGFESLPSPEHLVGVGDLVPPEPPENLVARTIVSHVELEWSPNTEADLAGYDLYRQVGDDWQRINSGLVTGTAFIEENLINGAHVYRITAVDQAGNESAPSLPALATVAAEPPGAPVMLGVIPQPEGRALSISWPASAGAIFYNLYRSEVRGGPYARVNGDALEDLAFEDHPLVNGREYFYVLTALDLTGNESAYSAEVRGVPEDTQPPEEPTWVSPARAGEQVVLERSVVPLIGYAEPGAAVEIFRNGVAIGATTATDTETIDSRNVILSGSGAIPSPDGTRIALLDNSYRLWVKDLATGEERQVLQHQVFSPVWAPDGRQIAYQFKVAWNRTRVAVVEIDSGSVNFASADDTAHERDPSWAEDGGKLVFASNRGGAWGVWVKDFGANTLTRVIQAADVYSPKMSPAGRKIAYIANSNLYWLDLEEQTTILVDQNVGTFNWSPDGGKLVSRSYSIGRYALSVCTLMGEEKTLITDSAELVSFPVFSPDGRSLAYARRDSGSLHSIHIADITGEGRRILSEIAGFRYLDWRSSGELLLVDGSGIHEIYPQGTFQLQGVDLYRGENHFYAIATDQAGNQGPSSQVMTVVYDNSRLPDLSVTAEEVFIYPLAPRSGEKVSVSSVVRNLSAAPAANVAVEIYLWDAAGDLKLIGSEYLPVVPAFGEVGVAVQFQAGTAAGKHTVIIVVDPANLIEETRQSNNTAMREFLVGDEERLELSATLDALLYRSKQDVGIEVSLMNGGRAQLLALEIAVEDELGRTVAMLTEAQVDLPFGAVKNFRPQWNTGSTFAGNYRLRATVRTSSGVLAEKLTPFAILPDVMVTAQIGIAAEVFRANEKVAVTISLKNSGFNHILAPVTVNTSILSSQGESIHQGQKAIPSLWPGMQSSLREEWSTGVHPPGEYRVKSDIHVGTALVETVSTAFVILPEAILSGEMTMDSAVVLAGGLVKMHFTLRNDGNVDISGTAQLMVLEPKSLEPLWVEELPVTLLRGVPQSTETVFSSTGFGLQSYSVALRFIGENVQKTVASASFTVKDGAPPVMTVLSPLAGETYEAAIPLSITSVDNLSGIARVQYRIDDGAWLNLPLADPASGRYFHLWEPAQHEGGAHTIRFRAEDNAGNSAESELIAFEIQMGRTPPVTEITLIGPNYPNEDGSVSISGETFLKLTAIDDFSGIARSEYRLDGDSWQTFTEPFRLAGLPEGEHTVRFRSVNPAGGQEAERGLRVILDNSPPATSLSLHDRAFLEGETVFIANDTQIHLSASDELSGVGVTWYRLDDGEWRFYQSPFTLAGLGYGSHQLEFRSIDRVENLEGVRSVEVVLIGVEAEAALSHPSRVLVWTEAPGGAESDARAALAEFFHLALPAPDAFFHLVYERNDFRQALASGLYGVAMIIGQEPPQDAGFIRELRDLVEAGTGLLISGWANNVHPLWQEALGINFRGSLSGNDGEREALLLPGPLGQGELLPIRGRVIRMAPDGGTVAAVLPAESVCNGVRRLVLEMPLEVEPGSRLTAILEGEKGKKLFPVDEERAEVTDAPWAAPINSASGNVAGDLAIEELNPGQIVLSLTSPYGYLDEVYHLTIVWEGPDGRLTEEVLRLTPACSAQLRLGSAIGPFTVREIDEDRVRTGDDLPLAVLHQFGAGHTAFLAFDLLASAGRDVEAHAKLLQRLALHLQPVSEPVTGSLALLETRLQLLGAAKSGLVRERLGQGLTYLPHFGLATSFPDFAFSEGEEAVYWYFVRLDPQAEQWKEAAVYLLFDGKYSLFEEIFLDLSEIAPQQADQIGDVP